MIHTRYALPLLAPREPQTDNQHETDADICRLVAFITWRSHHCGLIECPPPPPPRVLGGRGRLWDFRFQAHGSPAFLRSVFKPYRWGANYAALDIFDPRPDTSAETCFFEAFLTAAGAAGLLPPLLLAHTNATSFGPIALACHARNFARLASSRASRPSGSGGASR